MGGDETGQELCSQWHNRDTHSLVGPAEGTVLLARHDRDARGECHTGASQGREGRLDRLTSSRVFT